MNAEKNTERTPKGRGRLYRACVSTKTSLLFLAIFAAFFFLGTVFPQSSDAHRLDQYREAGDSIIEKKAKLTTKASGRFETDLFRTSEYSVGTGTYILKILKAADELSTSQKENATDTIEFTVPDVASINITDQIN